MLTSTVATSTAMVSWVTGATALGWRHLPPPLPATSHPAPASTGNGWPLAAPTGVTATISALTDSVVLGEPQRSLGKRLCPTAVASVDLPTKTRSFIQLRAPLPVAIAYNR